MVTQNINVKNAEKRRKLHSDTEADFVDLAGRYT